ncbi:MAG: esterase-like activity of phytase family protein [Gammaproteobacteria bacterium]|nr:esterase-like activity of phytase family protein [Gammaproteobacteria bacterium]
MRPLLIAILLAVPQGTPAEPLSIGSPHKLSNTYHDGDKHMGIRMMGAVSLSKVSFNGLPVQELSDLAWDDDEKILYAVSDNGHLVHLQPKFTGDILIGADLNNAYPLRDADGNPLRGPMADSEGLDIINGANGKKDDSELIISFERKPRVLRYRPDGALIDSYALPPYLADISHYSDSNKALEAVTIHAKLGVLTGPERPFKNSEPRMMTIYSLDGHQWSFPPYDPENGALVGLSATDDGSILVLERSYSFIFQPVTIALRRIRLPPAAAGNDHISVEEVVQFATRDQLTIDNFEGLSHHQGNRFFMISDDNNSAIQQTLLVYFEILAPSEAKGD